MSIGDASRIPETVPAMCSFTFQAKELNTESTYFNLSGRRTFLVKFIKLDEAEREYRTVVTTFSCCGDKECDACLYGIKQ
jgi:hypothetical protein